MIDLLSGARPAGDILGRVVRISIGGTDYVLPVRSIRANREWKAELTTRTAIFLAQLDVSEGAAAFEVLAGQPDLLIDLLLSYDTSGVLPSKDEIETMEPDVSFDLVAACAEVWRAASPLAASALARLTRDEASTSGSSTLTSSSPTRTAGRRRSSRTN